MSFNQEKWVDTFAKNLYADSDWYRIGKNWNKFVLGGTVHIPQAVTSITPQKITNGTSLPIATQRSTFGDKTFTNAMLVAPPRYVTNIDMSEASFDTRSSEMEDMVSYMRQAIDIEVMDKWSDVTNGSGSFARTTGTSTRSNIYGQATIKSITFADILNAKASLIRQSKNTKMDSLYLIVDPIMYNDLIVIDEFTKADALVVQTAVEGFVGMVAGCKVIQRSLGNPFTSGLVQPTTLLYDDSYDATHFSAALLVDSSKVGYALGTKENGEIKVGFEEYATGIYNDVLQAHTRVGAASLYSEDPNGIQGVYAIVETA